MIIYQIIIAILIGIECCFSQVITELSPPQPSFKQSSQLQFYGSGDSIQLIFNHIHSFSMSLYERQIPTKYSIIDDYKQHQQLYQKSQKCKLQPPEIQLTKIANISLDFDIKDIAVDYSNKTIYILSSQFQIFKLSFVKEDQDQIKLDLKPIRIIKVPKTNHLSYGEIYFSENLLALFIITESELYLLDTLKNQYVSLVGFVSNNIIKTKWYPDRIATINNLGQIIIYKIKSVSQVVVEKEISTYNSQTIQFIDIHWGFHETWLLSNSSIYVLSSQNSSYTQLNKIHINYGQNKLFQKVGSTVQLVFVLNNLTYIAEFGYINSTLILNRFYDSLINIESVTIINDLMWIVSEQQLMITHHSLNRQLLKQKLDLSFYFPSLQIKNIQFPKIINYQESMIMISSSNNNIFIHRYKRWSNKLECNMINPLEQYSIYIEMKTSVCTQSIFKYHSNNLTSYCIIRIGVQLNQINLHDRKTSNLITLVLASIIILLGIVVIGLTIHLKNSRYHYINKLLKIVQRKKRRAKQYVADAEPIYPNYLSSSSRVCIDQN